MRAFDGALTPNGTALSIPGAPARVVTDVGTERMTAENTAAMVVFDPQGERAIPVARNGASGIVLGTQPFAPTAALPAEATAIATLSRATRAEGATLVVTSDDGVSGRLTSFGQDAGGAWVQASSFAIGRGPHVLATARTVR